MNSTHRHIPDDGVLPPLQTLLCAYVPARQRGWNRLCWQLDQRLADVVRRGTEPTIAAIRLAWWDAVLVEDDRSKGGGEPLVEAWRGVAPADAAAPTCELIDGWRTLLGGEDLSADDLRGFAEKRGGGLFRLIALEQGAPSPALAPAGALWALWDLAGHVRDGALSDAAMAQAQAMLDEGPMLGRADAPKSLRLLHDLAVRDVCTGRVPAGGMAGRHYRRLLWRGLLA